MKNFKKKLKDIQLEILKKLNLENEKDVEVIEDTIADYIQNELH